MHRSRICRGFTQATGATDCRNGRRCEDLLFLLPSWEKVAEGQKRGRLARHGVPPLPCSAPTGERGIQRSHRPSQHTHRRGWRGARRNKKAGETSVPPFSGCLIPPVPFSRRFNSLRPLFRRCTAAQTACARTLNVTGPKVGSLEKRMTTIVTGRFSSPELAAHAVARLVESGFEVADTSSFTVDARDVDHPSAPALPVAANDAAKARTGEEIGSDGIAGAVGGASVGLAVGAIGAAFIGPPGLLLGVAAGGYVGSLVGALAGQGEATSGDGSPPATARHPADTLVAVRAQGSAQQLSAIDLLREEGAVDIEKVHGHFRDGKLVDFDRPA